MMPICIANQKTDYYIMILHIPHASTLIPYLDGFCCSPERLAAEIRLLTDHYTDELFFRQDSIIIQSSCSRIFCDMERFSDDAMEPNSLRGMGVLYTHADNGDVLRVVTPTLRSKILDEYYYSHHASLTEAVDGELMMNGRAGIIDCHSFPHHPLERDTDRRGNRPDFNIGTDPFHTPYAWVEKSVEFFDNRGYSLGVDWPYNGSIVPIKHYRKDPQVLSIMLEVNRRLYMDEMTGERLPEIISVQRIVQDYLSMIHSILLGFNE